MNDGTKSSASASASASTSNGHNCTVTVALVGDSDISRWPSDLYPSGGTNDDVCLHAQSGVTLEQSLPLLNKLLLDEQEKEEQDEPHKLVVVFCAGENDISHNIQLDDTLRHFKTLLDTLFPEEDNDNNNQNINNKSSRHLIVLGPKFEPWLENDHDTRMLYFKMTTMMDHWCIKFTESREKQWDKVNAAHTIMFVNCLTMFCGQSATEPGAVLADKAFPQVNLFDKDQLHLSREGYQIWKQVVEEHIRISIL